MIFVAAIDVDLKFGTCTVFPEYSSFVKVMYKITGKMRCSVEKLS